MDGMEFAEAGSSLVSITVLSVTPLRAGRLFALASVEIDIDGIRIEVRGIRAMRVATGATRVELPTFRDAAGQSRAAIVLPDEVHAPIGAAVHPTPDPAPHRWRLARPAAPSSSAASGCVVHAGYSSASPAGYGRAPGFGSSRRPRARGRGPADRHKVRRCRAAWRRIAGRWTA